MVVEERKNSDICILIAFNLVCRIKLTIVKTVRLNNVIIPLISQDHKILNRSALNFSRALVGASYPSLGLNACLVNETSYLIS